MKSVYSAITSLVIFFLLLTDSSAVDITVSTTTIENIPNVVSTRTSNNFTIVARNSQGDVVQQGGSIWSVRFIGPVYVSPTCINDRGNGHYIVSFILPQPGTYDVQIELKYKEVNTSNNTSCAKNRSKVFKMYTACNPKSDYYVSVDGLKGCNRSFDSLDCITSTKRYIECMDHVKDVCSYPHLIKQPLSVKKQILATGVGIVSPGNNKVCSTRAEVLGTGYWMNKSHTCSMGNNWKELGFGSERECRDSIYRCPENDKSSRDVLTTMICSAELMWRPISCILQPVSKQKFESLNRHFFFYGVSTIDEIARHMRNFYKPESILSLRNLRNSGDIPFLRKNMTFVLHGCGEQVATTLTLTLYDKHRHRTCHLFARNLHNLATRHGVAIDVIYQRHPVNYPRNAQTPDEIKNAIGRYPGSRGYMSTNELLTDFYYDIMEIYDKEEAPLSGILNQQEMTEALWGEYGDGLHYDNTALRFVMDTTILLLANAAILPYESGSARRHDPALGSCPSYFRKTGLYTTGHL